MAILDVAVPHSLSQEEALRRIKKILESLKRDHSDMINDLSETWDGFIGTFSFSVKGRRLSGTLTVTPYQIRLMSKKLPFGSGLFIGRAEQMIRQKAEEILA